MSSSWAIRLAVGAATLASVSCLNAPRPRFVVESGSLASLAGTSEIAVYGDASLVADLKAELAKSRPQIAFTRADDAQVVIQFQVIDSSACVDCGPDWSPGIIRSHQAFATVRRANETDRCQPAVLKAQWSHEAYSRKGLVRAFVKSLSGYLGAASRGGA
jgi:hypothetical protein